MNTYQIRNAESGEVLANNLTVEQVDEWWKEHESQFFGLRVTENVIEVVRT